MCLLCNSVSGLIHCVALRVLHMILPGVQHRQLADMVITYYVVYYPLYEILPKTFT